MRRILAVCALIGASLGLQAQSWTLEQCINHALENNLTVKQGDLTVRQTNGDIKETISDIKTNISDTVNRQHRKPYAKRHSRVQ